MKTEIKKPVFTNKEEYLAWRAEWRADYAKLSQEIREFKFARWASQSPNATESDMTRMKEIAAKAGRNSWLGFCSHLAIEKCREVARQMLSYRADSKVRAERLYQEAKASQKMAA